MPGNTESAGRGCIRRLLAFGIVFACGVLLARWQMMRMPIDNYHEKRMEIEELLEEFREELDNV